MSYEMDLDKFGSATLDFVAYDEEPPPAIRKDCRIRLIARGGFEMFAMTPLNGETEITDELQSGSPWVSLVRIAMDDNPYLSRDEIEYQSAMMTPEERQAKRYGKPTPFGGRVFKRFDSTVHAIERPDREWVRSMDTVVGIDPGIRWTGVSFNAFDSENGMLTFAELLLVDKAVPEVCAEIRRVCEHWGVDPMAYVIDPSARNRVATSGEHLEGAYQREGIMTVHGVNDLHAGVNELIRRLDAKQGGTPTPLWRISRECPRLLWEVPRYQQESRTDGVFAVKKVDDHVLDSARYAAMFRPWFLPDDVKPRRWWGDQNTWVPGTAPPFSGTRPVATSPVGS
jgi:phage terminase large subunit-like protein